jgi:hypothetical protein
MRWRRSSHSSPRGWAANYSSPTEWAITNSTGLRWRLLEADERREELRVVEFLLVHEKMRIRPRGRHEIRVPDDSDPCPRESLSVEERDATVAEIRRRKAHRPLDRTDEL